MCEFMVILCAVSGADPVRNHQVMKTYVEMVVELRVFLTLVLDGGGY
jgi:hypothetical protein